MSGFRYRGSDNVSEFKVAEVIYLAIFEDNSLFLFNYHY